LPYSDGYNRGIPEGYYEYFSERVAEFKYAHHIDFLPDIPNPDWMSDGNHLNIDGAEVYSRQINEFISASTGSQEY